MRGEQSSSFTTTGDDVQDPRWEAGLGNKVSYQKGIEWCLLGSLINEGVSGGEGRSNVRCKVYKSSIPGGNGGADTSWCPFNNLRVVSFTVRQFGSLAVSLLFISKQ